MLIRGVVGSPVRGVVGSGFGDGEDGVNAARYAEYIAFADPRAGLYAIPDGQGGKRAANVDEFWATPANVSIDTATNGVPDMVLSAQTTLGAAVIAPLAATEATLVFESYGLAIGTRVIRPNAGGDLYLLISANDARMVASSVVLQCARRRGSITSRFRGITGWSAAGRTIALNGGNAAEDTTQPGTRSSPNFAAGRYSFIGVISTRKSAAWIKGNSFPEPTAVINGDSMAQGSSDLGFWSSALSALIPGSPPMENMGIGGETGAQILTRFTAESASLTAKRILWGGHNSYDPDTWKTQVADMIAYTSGGLSNFALLPVFPSAADDADRRASKAALHAYFKSAYGPHYIHEALENAVALGGPGQAYEDATSFAKGVPPSGLRFDDLHLNPTGNEGVVAPAVRAAYARMGWRV